MRRSMIMIMLYNIYMSCNPNDMIRCDMSILSLLSSLWSETSMSVRIFIIHYLKMDR